MSLNYSIKIWIIVNISTDNNDSYCTVIKTMTTRKRNKDDIDNIPAPEQTSISAFYLCGKAGLDTLKLNKIWIIG